MSVHANALRKCAHLFAAARLYATDRPEDRQGEGVKRLEGGGLSDYSRVLVRIERELAAAANGGTYDERRAEADLATLKMLLETETQ
jgi:hypothetical protein